MKFNLKSFKAGLSRFFGKDERTDVSENHGRHLITEKSSMRILEAYRMARTNLFYSGNGKEGGVVFGVTSASPSDGKSLTCANLAISFAMSGKRVLLVDCDMRKPTQKIAFGVEAENGLSEYLAGVTDAPMIVSTNYENLFLLSSGRCPPNPAELLYSPRFTEMMAKARAEYDFIFIDFPPIGLISDATIVVPHIDAYIMIVRMMQSDYRAVQAAAESLEQIGAKIAGLVINDVEDKSATYYYRGGRYGRYRRYGKYYGKYYRKYYGRYGDYAKKPADESNSDFASVPVSNADTEKTGENADS